MVDLLFGAWPSNKHPMVGPSCGARDRRSPCVESGDTTFQSTDPIETALEFVTQLRSNRDAITPRRDNLHELDGSSLGVKIRYEALRTY